jgi:lipoate-protein ligase A
MYAVILSLQLRPQLRSIDRAHSQILGAIAAALRPGAPELTQRGICDLAIGEKKVSGNSARAKRDHLLYHGTLLYDFPLEMLARCLAMPPRQPDYRMARPHDAFVANIPLDATVLRSALRSAWSALETCPEWPQATTQRLVVERYSRPEWNEQL